MERNSRSSKGSERGGRDSERGSSRGREESGRGGGRSFEYKKRDPSKLNERSKSLGGGDFDKIIRDGVGTFTPADGDNMVRILPPTWDNPDHYGYDIWMHYKVGPDEQAYLCLQKMKGEDCPICEERKKADADGDGDDDYAKELKPKQRVLVAVIDRDNEKEGVLAWSMPWTIDKDLISRSQDKRTGEVLSLDDPNEGYDVEFKKEGKGKGTKYIGIALARRESPLGNKKWLEWIQDNPLPTLLQYFDYDHIASVFGGTSSKSKGRDKSHDVDDQDRQLKEVETRGDKGSARSARGASRQAEPDLTWDSIHSMTFDELAALVDDQKLSKIEPNESKDDEELADWICEDLDIKKAVARRKVADDKEDESPAEKLKEMRRRREG